MQNCKNKYLCRIKQSEHVWKQPLCKLVKTEKDFCREIEKVGVPSILKPLNGLGSAFTVKIEQMENAKSLFISNKEKCKRSSLSKEKSISDYWVLEECLEGFQISVESYTFDGETTVICINDKLNPIVPPYFRVEYSVTPSKRISKELMNKISTLTKDALKAVDFKNGISHTEFRVSEYEVNLLEINVRIGGGLIAHSTYYSTGINLFQLAVDIALDRKSDLKINQNTPTVFKVIYPKELGKIIELEGFEKLLANKRFDVVKQLLYKGDVVSLGSRIGLVLATSKQGETIDDLINFIEEETKLIKIKTESLNFNDEPLSHHINNSSHK